MELNRKPFQGVFNIVRFNWHFYAILIMIILALCFIALMKSNEYGFVFWIIITLLVVPSLLSLIISWYLYDVSDLYDLNEITNWNNKNVLNIHAGFDESSMILNHKFKDSNITIADFYDPSIHTEISIKRARKAFPPINGTIRVKTQILPFQNNEFHHILVFFSAHEIRNQKERTNFFKELRRVLKDEGEIIVVEHLRNTWNFLAYTIGFYHFYSSKSWIKTFQNAGFYDILEHKRNKFISYYFLKKDGITP